MTFDNNYLKLAINNLINQSFFSVGNLAFRQAVGIPTVFNPVLFVGNLFLFTYEPKWVL